MDFEVVYLVWIIFFGGKVILRKDLIDFYEIEDGKCYELIYNVWIFFCDSLDIDESGVIFKGWVKGIFWKKK